MEKKDKRSKWVKPILTILMRGAMNEEAVLAACKTWAGLPIGPTGTYCGSYPTPGHWENCSDKVTS